MTQHLVRQRATKLRILCVLVRQSKSIAQADARKQALCSQRTSYAHRPRRRLSVRSGLAVLGYEADCQKLTSEGGSPVLPTNHSLEQQRQHGKIPLMSRRIRELIYGSTVWHVVLDDFERHHTYFLHESNSK